MRKIYLTLLLMALGVPSLLAQIYVTETGGAVTKDGQTWATAYDKTQLQQAINGAASGQQIWVAKGTYKPTESLSTTGFLTGGTIAVTDRDKTFILKADVEIYGGFAGNETNLNDRVFDPLTGLLVNETILSGDLNNNNVADDGDHYHVVSSRNNSNGAVLDGFTIQHGYANGAESITENGAVIWQGNGGAVALVGTSTRATFSNLVVKNNTSTKTGDGNGGGAFHINNGTNVNAYLISNVTFQDNTGPGGGALFVRGLTLDLNKSVFENNTATISGGAVYFYSGVHTVSEVLFEGNTAGTTGGGAIYGVNNASLAIQKSTTFKSNTSNTSGGAIYFTQHGQNNSISETVFDNNTSNGGSGGGAILSLSRGLVIDKTVFKNNTAEINGGALYLNSLVSSSGTPNHADTKISNTIFYNNLSKNTGTGANGGGAIFQTRGINGATSANTTATVVNSTFYANKSVNTSGVYSFGDLSPVKINLYNNIFYGNLQSYDIDNETGTGADLRSATSAHQTYSYNLFQSVTSSGGNRIVVMPYYLDGTNPQPLFASTTEGAYNFLWPIENSYAINKGDNTLYTDNMEDVNTSKDLLGNKRLVGANVDFGAIEWATVLPVTVSSFTANLVNGRTQLKWSVGTEDNVNRYEVERSQNGIDFTTVATVSANGSASYQAADNQPQAGTNYYRLVTVDNDGSRNVHKDLQTVKVASLSASTVQVYPNPVKGNEVKVSLGGAAGTYSYKLVNTSGGVVQQGSVNYNGSSAVISVASLPAGVYVLCFSNGTQAKLVKQ